MSVSSPLPNSTIVQNWTCRFTGHPQIYVGQISVWIARTTSPTESPLSAWIRRASETQSVTRPAEYLGLPLDCVNSPVWVSKTQVFAEIGGELHTIQDTRLLALAVSVGATELPNSLRTFRAGDDWHVIPIIQGYQQFAVAVARDTGTNVYAADANWALGETPILQLNQGADIAPLLKIELR